MDRSRTNEVEGCTEKAHDAVLIMVDAVRVAAAIVAVGVLCWVIGAA